MSIDSEFITSIFTMQNDYIKSLSPVTKLSFPSERDLILYIKNPLFMGRRICLQIDGSDIEMLFRMHFDIDTIGITIKDKNLLITNTDISRNISNIKTKKSLDDIHVMCLDNIVLSIYVLKDGEKSVLKIDRETATQMDIENDITGIKNRIDLLENSRLYIDKNSYEENKYIDKELSICRENLFLMKNKLEYYRKNKCFQY